MTKVRIARRVAIAAVLAAVACSAAAEDQYPTRSMTMIVPFAAGGPTDILARIVSQYISPLLGQPIVVVDTTGAGGTIGATQAARAAPDGYTMLMGNLGTNAAALGLYKKLPYDPRTDFEPVILVASTPMVLVTRKDLPVHSLSDFVAYAKAHRDKVTMGSAGIGSISHLTLLLFNHLTGAGVVHVPYRGLSEASNDLLGGQIDTLFDQVVTATPHIRSGAENAIVVTIPSRTAALPDVPSTTEAGTPELITVAWTALFMPKDTPKLIVRRINSVVRDAMQDPAISKRLAEIGADIPPPDQRTPESLGRLVNAEVDKWVPLLKAAGVQGE